MNAYAAAAELLVVFYLRGRAMEASAFRAAILAAQWRLVQGDVPVLDEGLRRRIDAQAVAGRSSASAETRVDSVARWRSHG